MSRVLLAAVLVVTIVVPHAALLAVPFLSPTPTTLGLFVVGLALTGYGTTVCYHRYFAHKAFKTSRAGQFVLAVVGCTSTQLGPLWWCAHHRRHHAHSDRPGDVHSPVVRGLFFAHVGWLLEAWTLAPCYRNVRDLARYPELRWLNRLWLVPPLLAVAAFYLVDGWEGVVLGFCLPVVIVKQSAFAVNSIGHRYGAQPFATGDGSRNNVFLGLFAMGEGWHNNHHHSPRMANFGRAWYHLDTGYAVILLLEQLGLVWDVKKCRGPAAAAGSGVGPASRRPARAS